MSDILCPICSADLPFSGEEDPGDVVVCSACSCPLLIKSISDQGDPVLAADF